MVSLVNSKQKILGITIVVSISIFYSIIKIQKIDMDMDMDKNLTYIITDTKEPDSFDPLEADSSNNLPVMRMIYASILQVNSKNELHSIVLENFNYNSNEKTINLKILKGQKYADGDPITAEDITLTILRVALENPNFPVVKDILGINEWRNLKTPLKVLPSGINLSDDSITISLSRHYANPLFRFCLELFSVIPKKCIELNTNKINCVTPPASGFYEISDKTHDRILFKKRKLSTNFNDNVYYDKIEFKYTTLEEQCNKIPDKNEIIASNESSFSSLTCNTPPWKNQIKWLPASRFGMILFNPNITPFNKSDNRQKFSIEVRKIMAEENLNFVVEASIFTKIIPGYLSRENLELSKNDNVSDFKGTNLYIPKFSSAINKQTIDSIKTAAKRFEMNLIELQNAPGNESINKFLNNEASFMIGSSGFWAQDPIGDLSMFFSENLHKPLSFVWKDKKTYSLIREIEDETDPLKIKNRMESLNKHLYHESLIAPIVHFRRLYITHESIKTLNLPVAVTSPAPWHLIPEE